MTYQVDYTPHAIKALEKMDKFTRRMLIGWIDKNLVGCSNPRAHGKPLSTNRVGQWRYRVGDYRIVSKIEDGKLLILIITIGHRREVYDER